jgi:hypothetical protein
MRADVGVSDSVRKLDLRVQKIDESVQRLYNCPSVKCTHKVWRLIEEQGTEDWTGQRRYASTPGRAANGNRQQNLPPTSPSAG